VKRINEEVSRMQQGFPIIQTTAFSFKVEGHFHVSNISINRVHQSGAMQNECSSIREEREG
jgi:hypothetical protein